MPDAPLDDVREASNYVAALTHGLARMNGGFPLRQRLMQEMHEVLFSSVPGTNKCPGEYRHVQNWIGGPSPEYAQYVPPPAGYVPDLMSNLEKFIHEDGRRFRSFYKQG